MLIGPAERAEVVIDFAGMLGEEVVLESVPRTDGGGALGVGVGATSAAVMQFRVTRDAVDDSSVPEQLRPLAGAGAVIVADARSDVGGGPRLRRGAQRHGVDVQRSGLPRAHGRRAADARHDRDVAADEPDERLARHPHPRHRLRHARRATASRHHRGKPGLKETFLLDPGDTVLVAGRFTDNVGTFVVHCHMLEHEDHGMMGQYEVVVAGRPGGARHRFGDVVLHDPAGDVAGPVAAATRVSSASGRARGGGASIARSTRSTTVIHSGRDGKAMPTASSCAAPSGTSTNHTARARASTASSINALVLQSGDDLGDGLEPFLVDGGEAAAEVLVTTAGRVGLERHRPLLGDLGIDPTPRVVEEVAAQAGPNLGLAAHGLCVHVLGAGDGNDGFGEQLRLAREVQVDRAGRQASLLGDMSDGRALVAALGEDIGCGIDDPLTGGTAGGIGRSSRSRHGSRPRIRRWHRVAARAVSAGVLLPADAAEIEVLAESSSVGADR